MPEEGELVLCTVTSIQPNSVFARLDEFNRQGMIHISEISPGRIRNIRDFVKEDKKIVCMVLRIHQEKGYIDLSLRRVNDSQKKKKIEYIKQLQRAEKILEFVANNIKSTTSILYTEIMGKIGKDYPDLISFFNDIVTENTTMDKYGIDAKYAKALEEVIRQRIKPPEVEIEGVLSIETFHDDGVDSIKRAFSGVDGNTVQSYYMGGGKYHLETKSTNYKDAEDVLNAEIAKVTALLEKEDAKVSFHRIEKKKK